MSHTILSSKKQQETHANVVVLFNADHVGASLLFNANVEEYKDNPLALINPELSHLVNFTTDRWRLVDGTIVGITALDKPVAAESVPDMKFKTGEVTTQVFPTKETIIIEKKDEQLKQDVQVHGGILTTLEQRVNAIENAPADLSAHSRIDQLASELHAKNRDLSRALQLQSKELQILTRRADLLLSETSDLQVENREQLRLMDSTKEKVQKLEQKCNVYNKVMIALAILSLVEFIIISFK